MNPLSLEYAQAHEMAKHYANSRHLAGVMTLGDYIVILDDGDDYKFVVRDETAVKSFEFTYQAHDYVANHYDGYDDKDIKLVEVNQQQFQVIDWVGYLFSDDKCAIFVLNHLNQLSEFKLNQLCQSFDKLGSISHQGQVADPTDPIHGVLAFIDDCLRNVGFCADGDFIRAFMAHLDECNSVAGMGVSAETDE